jgi:hypothetical protein
VTDDETLPEPYFPLPGSTADAVAEYKAKQDAEREKMARLRAARSAATGKR